MKKKKRVPGLGDQSQPASKPPAVGKKRGAPAGNHNAVKHGFYSAMFKAAERRLLDNIPATDLSAEIELIRVANVRFLESLQASNGARDFAMQLTALRAVNLSAHSIATLLRAQAITALAHAAFPDDTNLLQFLSADD